MPWWAEPTILFFFLTVVFLVFYAVACSTILGIRDNYYRYAQKSLAAVDRSGETRQEAQGDQGNLAADRCSGERRSGRELGHFLGSNVGTLERPGERSRDP